MSFWDRLGNLAKDTTNALVAQPKFLWDVASAPWNDDEQFNGFQNTFKSAGEKWLQATVKPIADIAETPGIKQGLQAIDNFNREYIREPLTTGLLAATETRGDFSQAHQMAQTTSFGQALFGAGGALLPGQQAVDKIDFNNEAEVDKFFANGAPRFWSGLADTGIQVFGDVTIAAGKAGKVARGSELITNRLDTAKKAAKAINEIGEATATTEKVNKYSTLIDDFTANDSFYAYNHPMLKNSPLRDTLAYALGQTKDQFDEFGNLKTVDEFGNKILSGREQTGLILRAAIGDPRAAEELRKVRADLALPMDRQMGILDKYQEFLIAAKNDPEALAMLPHADQQVVQEALDELNALRKNDAEFAAWEEMATKGGVITRTTGAAPMQAFDDFLAKGRSSKFESSRAAEGAKVEAWQPTPFHRMYQVVSWLGQERPAGIVNLNDGESSREVMSFIQRALAHSGDEAYDFVNPVTGERTIAKGVTHDSAETMMQHYLAATTPEQRAESISIIENAAFRAIAGKHGISPDKADEIYRNYYRARLTAQESLRKNGFMIDEDGSIISAPVFESQTANYMPMMDIDLLNTLLKRHQIARKSKSLATVYGLGNEVVGVMDALQVMFKAGVLMRLGYTLRNGAEAQLRIAASTGAMASMRHLGPGMKNFLYNTKDNLAMRTVDRFDLSGGPITYQQTKNQLQSLDRAIADLEARYVEVRKAYDDSVEVAKYAQPPVEREFRSTVLSDEELNLLDQGITPERFGVGSDEFVKAEKLERKRLKDEYRALGNPQSGFFDRGFAQKADEVQKAFGLSSTDRVLFDKKGLIPLNKVLEAFRSGRINADELSAIISTGSADAASYLGRGESAYEYLDEATLIARAVRNGKSRGKYVEVSWRNPTEEEYINDGIDQLYSNWDESKQDELLSNWRDELNQHYIDQEAYINSYVQPVADIQAVADMNLLDMQLKKFRTLREEQSAQLTRIEKAQAKGKEGKRKIGQGQYKIKTQNGEEYFVDDARGGRLADIHMANASAENSMNLLVDDNAGLVSHSLVKTGYGKVDPSAPNYYQAWAYAINYQFRNSAVAMKIIGGESNQAVVRWLRTDPEGRIVAQRLSLDPWELDGHVASVRGFVDTYIPSFRVRNLINDTLDEKAPVSPELLRSVSAGSELPTIHGHILEENLNMVSTKHFKSIVNGVFKFIGSMPEDAFARHPFYISLYRNELQRRVNMMEGLQDSARLTSDQLQTAMDMAHRVAVQQLKNTLFTIERKTNLAHYMRFISPFFSAFENSAKTWARIAYEKPQTINRANLIFTAPNRAGIATDENGNPVPPEEASVNDYIWLEVPKSIKNLPFVGKGLASLDQMGIQKKSLDVVFQGDALHVPVGPYVAMPISEIVKRRPELEKTLQWAIPYGPERNTVRALLPTWVKRQLIKNDGMESQQYANTYALIWTTEQHKRRELGQAAATPAEVQKMTDAYYNMRTVANLVLPFAPTFQTPYKFYIDQWRQYQEQYGMQAQEKFWQTYGDDFFEFTQSLSKNTTGSFATVGSVQNAKAHADLISELSVIDPKLIGIVTNAGQAYDFSQAAYIWQQANTISPSSGETFRGRKDPAEAELDNQRSLGWIKYRSVMAGIDSEMQRRGLTSLQSKKAADLASMKKQLVTQLGAQNKEWYDDYLDTDGSKTNKVIRGLEMIIGNDKFMSQYGDNPTFKSIAVYLSIRQSAEQALANRESKSINSKKNADIKYLMEDAVNQLKQQDIGFGDLYDRWLSYDPIYDAVHSQGVIQ